MITKTDPSAARFRTLVAAIALVLGLVFPGAGLAQDEAYKPGKKTATPASKAPSKAPSSKSPAKPSPTLKDEGNSLFGGGGGDKSGNSGAAVWTIVIEAFRSESQAADAAAGLDRVRTEGGLSEAYSEKRGDAVVIAFGRYTDPTSKQAKADLARVRGTQVVMDGQTIKPFSGAFLAPPTEIHGTMPEFDLSNAKKLNGDWVLYTLQVGVYSREDQKPATPAEMAEFRKTAEEAVVQLRREGEQAFYSHGPNRSMVTIGLFGEEDFDATSKFESPALRALRKRFPYNLQNGMGIKQRFTVTDPKTGQQMKKERIQPSGLVQVPDSE